MSIAQEMYLQFVQEYEKEGRKRREWMEEHYAKPLIETMEARRLARMAAETSLEVMSWSAASSSR